MAIKLEVKVCIKYLESVQRAFKYILKRDYRKEQILEKQGLSLGVKDASLAH